MKRKLIVLGVLVAGFMVGYGFTSVQAYYGQSPGYGYFTGAGYDLSGWEVLNVSCSTGGEYGPYNYNNGQTWCNSIPRDLNSAGELIAFIEGRLANGVPNGSYGFGSGTYGDTRARTGAAAIVHTMIGTPTGSRSRPPTATQMADWRALVNAYAAAGRINWSVNAGFNVNSLYQGTDNSPSPNDVTFYSQYRDGLTIVFTAPNGTQYGIRRECGNPMGGTSLPDLQNFDMTGSSAVTSNPTPLPGETVVFTHTVHNNGPTATSPTSITWSAQNPATGATTAGPSNSGTYNSGQSKSFTESVVVPGSTTPGTQICRRVAWSPDQETGGSGVGAPACATVRYDFELTPSVTAVITSGGVPITGNIAELGDTITFTYSVSNGGLTVSQTVTCTYRTASWPGYNLSAPTTVFTPAGSNCPPPRTFPAGSNTTTATEANVAASPINTTLCRSLTIAPVSESGSPASRIAQACVAIASKPYTRVYGGDVSAGSLINCSTNANAHVVGWNRRSGGGWAGAGTQYATYAMNRITDFATALGNTGGAPRPNGLSFANTSGDANNGWFGGNIGTLPCLTNHYATLPAGSQVLTTPINLSAIPASGSYQASGNVTIANGAIPTGSNRIDLFVNGNVYINSNITYPGTWSVSGIPRFRLIVQGNIYIDNDVNNLDGLYVAQRNGAVGGELHTCIFGGGFTPPPLSGTFFSDCDNKLTVNGALVAYQLRLLRTIGTVSQSNNTDASSVPHTAEVINYGPAHWIPQPESTTPAGDYDAIISLPPVL